MARCTWAGIRRSGTLTRSPTMTTVPRDGVLLGAVGGDDLVEGDLGIVSRVVRRIGLLTHRFDQVGPLKAWSAVRGGCGQLLAP